MTIHHHISPGARSDDEGASDAAILRQIAALAGSIQPGPRHRDQMLESVSDCVGRSRSKSRSAKLVVVLSLSLIVISPVLSLLTQFRAPVPQTAEQANVAALHRAEAKRMSFDWALVDIFSQFREDKRSQ